MRLEDEIKQPKFGSEYEKLAVNLIFTYNWLNSAQFKFFKEHNLTTQQFNVLRILRGQYPNAVSVNLIKERMLDRMSDASRLVDRLLAKDLVERKVCPNDRRKADVVITKKALQLLAKLDNELKAVYDKFKTLSDSEAGELNRLLDKLRG